MNRKQISLAGIETYVWVYQTAMDLLNLGYEAQVVADVVSSRNIAPKTHERLGNASNYKKKASGTKQKQYCI